MTKSAYLMMMEHFTLDMVPAKKMLKNILIPISILIHLIVELVYLFMCKFKISTEYFRDVFYFIGDPLCMCISLSAIILGLWFYGMDSKDVQFLIVYAGICFLRVICYALNYLHLMNRTNNLWILLTGTILVSVIVLISGGRHGYFNEK